MQACCACTVLEARLVEAERLITLPCTVTLVLRVVPWLARMVPETVELAPIEAVVPTWVHRYQKTLV